MVPELLDRIPTIDDLSATDAPRIDLEKVVLHERSIRNWPTMPHPGKCVDAELLDPITVTVTSVSPNLHG